MQHVTILFESNPKVAILVWILLYILTSHLVFHIYLILVLKIYSRWTYRCLTFKKYDLNLWNKSRIFHYFVI